MAPSRSGGGAAVDANRAFIWREGRQRRPRGPGLRPPGASFAPAEQGHRPRDPSSAPAAGGLGTAIPRSLPSGGDLVTRDKRSPPLGQRRGSRSKASAPAGAERGPRGKRSRPTDLRGAQDAEPPASVRERGNAALEGRQGLSEAISGRTAPRKDFPSRFRHASRAADAAVAVKPKKNTAAKASRVLAPRQIPLATLAASFFIGAKAAAGTGSGGGASSARGRASRLRGAGSLTPCRQRRAG